MKYQPPHKTAACSALPNTPGVYIFRGPRRKILYIGKATSLYDRVRSYFNADLSGARGEFIVQMIEEARSVDAITTDSVLEALILEARLIRKHKPKYNTIGKDDKSFNYVVFTKEEYPRILVVRGRELDRRIIRDTPQAIYGPFPHGTIFKEAMKIIRKIFPFRDACTPAKTFFEKKLRRASPCFNRQLGLCPGVCTGEISKQEYARTIRHIKLFFEGKKSALLKKLKREMKGYAKKQEFEKAARTKKTIFALNHIQDIALLKGSTLSNSKGQRIEGYDVAHISGTDTVGVMVVVENGEMKKSDYRKFRIKKAKKGSDTAALKEILSRRLAHTEWPLPQMFVVDGGRAQKNTALHILKEYGFQIPVVSVVKDRTHRQREILGDRRFRQEHEKEILLANSEAHRFVLAYHKRIRTL